jgi:hypothetical protein
MNLNVAAQNQGVLAWRAVAASNINPGIDLRHHVNFAFTFQVIDAIAVDAVFEFVAAPPSDADPCVPGPFVDVEEVLTCRASWGTMPAAETKITIPAGTPEGSLCTATLPCKPNAFIKVQPVSGDTGMLHVVAILGGPK